MRRRTLLTLGLATGAALTAAGGLALLWQPAMRDGQLTPQTRSMWLALAPAVLDGLLPPDPSARQQALGAWLQRLQGTLDGLPPALQGEVAELMTVLVTAPGRRALTGLASAWERADVAEVRAALQSMRLSSWTLRQQAYRALRDLTNAAWFADPSTWARIGYPGPHPV